MATGGGNITGLYFHLAVVAMTTFLGVDELC